MEVSGGPSVGGAADSHPDHTTTIVSSQTGSQALHLWKTSKKEMKVKCSKV